MESVEKLGCTVSCVPFRFRLCFKFFFHGCFPEKLLVGLRPSSQHLKALKKLYVLLDIFHVVFGNLLSEFWARKFILEITSWITALWCSFECLETQKGKSKGGSPIQFDTFHSFSMKFGSVFVIWKLFTCVFLGTCVFFFGDYRLDCGHSMPDFIFDG